MDKIQAALSVCRRYWCAAAVLIFLLLAFAPVRASAQSSPSASKVLHACYVPGSGTVYRIKEPGLKNSCSSPNHVEFSWTDSAVSGGAGWELTHHTVAVTHGSGYAFYEVRCPSGKKVLQAFNMQHGAYYPFFGGATSDFNGMQIQFDASQASREVWLTCVNP